MLIKLVCPQCGASMDIDDSRERAFCQYCGMQLVNMVQRVNINQNVNVSGTVIHQMDRSTEPNLYLDFSSSEPGAVMVVTFDNTRIKRIVNNGQTAALRLPLGSYVVFMTFAGKRYKRSITIVDYAPVHIYASALRRREIVIDQPDVKPQTYRSASVQGAIQPESYVFPRGQQIAPLPTAINQGASAAIAFTCANCGYVNNHSSPFCPQCGAKLQNTNNT